MARFAKPHFIDFIPPLNQKKPCLSCKIAPKTESFLLMFLPMPLLIPSKNHEQGLGPCSGAENVAKRGKRGEKTGRGGEKEAEKAEKKADGLTSLNTLLRKLANVRKDEKTLYLIDENALDREDALL